MIGGGKSQIELRVMSILNLAGEHRARRTSNLRHACEHAVQYECTRQHLRVSGAAFDLQHLRPPCEREASKAQ